MPESNRTRTRQRCANLAIETPSLLMAFAALTLTGCGRDLMHEAEFRFRTWEEAAAVVDASSSGDAESDVGQSNDAQQSNDAGAGTDAGEAADAAAPMDAGAAADAGAADADASPDADVKLDATSDTLSQSDTGADGEQDSTPFDAGGPCAGKADGESCGEGTNCSIEVCIAGACVEQPKTCDDGSVCTDDGCDPKSGCVFTPNGKTCACQSTADCSGMGDKCTGELVCVDKKCVVSGSNKVACDKSADSACSTNICVPETGTCAMTEATNGSACDDGNVCTGPDGCQAGKCVGAANTANCDDGKACTESDVCAGKMCGGKPLNCEADGDPCTVGTCEEPKGCVQKPTTAFCDDGDACTDKDTCFDGKCTPGKATDCDDGKVCTDDACDKTKGCANTPNSETCDDGDACTTKDGCKEGACVGGPAPDCDDGNACTKDSCDKAKGCEHAPLSSGSCDDGNACTESDSCDQGTCGGNKVTCKPSDNVCVEMVCDAKKGCSPQPKGGKCDDGNQCTDGDVCADGSCKPGAPATCADGDVCTQDNCDTKTGQCNYVKVPNCCTTNTGCDDGNACTADLCKANKCTHSPVSDGATCATGICADGVCKQQIVDVTAGAEHACALLSGGSAICWGQGDFGRLGDGATADRFGPVAVKGLVGITSISAGNQHTCAVANSKAWCWGRNQAGQVEPGKTGEHLVPHEVTGLPKVKVIAAGYAETCALTQTGEVWCWGNNSSCQLGTGSCGSAPAPAKANLPAGKTATALAAAHSSACALLSDKTVVCWGQNDYGQAGASLSDKVVYAPKSVGNLPDAIALSAGHRHFCAVRSGGSVVCWGSNYNGEFGHVGAEKYGNTPVSVNNIGDATTVAAGGASTCALTTSGSTRCWGSNGDYKFDSNSEGPHYSAVDVAWMSKAKKLAVGDAFTCALLGGADLRCVGGDVNGQLGDGAGAPWGQPVKVKGITTAKGVGAGRYFSCAVLQDGSVRCWGDGTYGQIGSKGAKEAAPIEVPTLAGIDTLVSGGYHTCAHKGPTSNGVWCWGRNAWYQLGDGSNNDSASPVLSWSGSVSGFMAGSGHSCLLDTGGKAYCWGENSFGYLGVQGQKAVYPSPTDESFPGATAMSAGGDFSCVLAGGIAKCWGKGLQGQLGWGKLGTSSSKPGQVTAAKTLLDLGCGWDHCCAVESGKTAVCWGYNGTGQLGAGSQIAQSASPVQVTNLTDAVQVVGGAYHTCASHVDGTVSCWGGTSSGQLGIGVTDPVQHSPVKVKGLADVTELAAGAYHTCALTKAGTIYCWGSRNYGELGDGGAFSKTPVTVKWQP